jgi:hypothetical protein
MKLMRLKILESGLYLDNFYCGGDKDIKHVKITLPE